MNSPAATTALVHLSMYGAANTRTTNCGLTTAGMAAYNGGRGDASMDRVGGYASHGTCPACIAAVKALKKARKAVAAAPAPAPAPRMTLWRAPSGRLHVNRRCSSNGVPARAVKVRLERDEYATAALAGQMCPCVRTWRPDGA